VNVRSASFRDLHRIEELYRDGLSRDCQGSELSSDCPVPQATLMRLWSAVSKTISSLVPLGDSGDALYVAEDPTEGIVGFIQAQATASKPKGWQILNLCVSSSGAGHFAAERLVTHLCNRGLEHGVTRFYVRMPLDHVLIPVFQAQGFTQFATEQILYHDDPAPRSDAEPALRPARRDDVGALYLLYLRITPSHVASLEGPSLKAWQAAFAGGMLSRLGRDDVRHHIGEESSVMGWAAIRPASSTRPTALTLMCESQDTDFRDRFVNAVLGELPDGPVSCVLRHYDSELIRALQKLDFAVYGTQLLLVRDLGTKLRVKHVSSSKKPVLVHAGLARTVPVSAPAARLRVLGQKQLGRDTSTRQ
jgi:hypothetical protein